MQKKNSNLNVKNLTISTMYYFLSVFFFNRKLRFSLGKCYNTSYNLDKDCWDLINFKPGSTKWNTPFTKIKNLLRRKNGSNFISKPLIQPLREHNCKRDYQPKQIIIFLTQIWCGAFNKYRYSLKFKTDSVQLHVYCQTNLIYHI